LGTFQYQLRLEQGPGAYIINKTVVFEKEVFSIFFYSRIPVKNAVSLNIQKSEVKIWNFTEKNLFSIGNITPDWTQKS
jgi:hypothetical protein